MTILVITLQKVPKLLLGDVAILRQVFVQNSRDSWTATLSLGCRECSEAAIKHLVGGLVEPTHLKNMRRSNWIMNPQISA